MPAFVGVIGVGGIGETPLCEHLPGEGFEVFDGYVPAHADMLHVGVAFEEGGEPRFVELGGVSGRWCTSVCGQGLTRQYPVSAA